MGANSVLLVILAITILGHIHAFKFRETTIEDIQKAFKHNQLSSRELVEFYIEEIRKLNPVLRGVIEVNPDALFEADRADNRRKVKATGSRLGLHGIPILVKDSIGTKDKMNTTGGSYALVGSVVGRDAGVIRKLRKAGAIILGKSSMSEWASIRSSRTRNGWCARSGQGKNPYVLSAETCGSSSGSAISVAANMVAVSLGTETDGSILCPSSFNSVVGFKPTVGLTSRAGVIPVSHRQDTIGPIGRTVADVVHVLDVIVGVDHRDKATKKASKYIPRGGYAQFLKRNGLKGKRLGIVRNPFFSFKKGSVLSRAFKNRLQTLRQKGAVLVDHLEIDNVDKIVNFTTNGELQVLFAEFKLTLRAYLKGLVESPVRSLEDVIAFNEKFSDLEMTQEFGQDMFLASQATNGMGKVEKAALSNMLRLSKEGFEKVMVMNKLDALVNPCLGTSHLLAFDGFPGISVPAGYDEMGVPFGICFGGLKGAEPNLIQIAYAFEQATNIRKYPSFKP